jgi:hypothetical protein
MKFYVLYISKGQVPSFVKLSEAKQERVCFIHLKFHVHKMSKDAFTRGIL